MVDKNNLSEVAKVLADKKIKKLAMLAPSFVLEFGYPDVVIALRKLGFDKVVELTFGAKIVNSEYHKLLGKGKMLISTACPGVTEFIKNNYPSLRSNLVRVDSPMIATAKVCKKSFPKHKVFFISPCNFKKQEANGSKYVDYTIDYQQLKGILIENKIGMKHKKPGKYQLFDCFYNDYTKIYPMAGGLSKTAHLKGILKQGEEKVIDGVANVKKYLDVYIKNPDKKIKFLDINFCVGGCLGGPFTSKDKTIEEKKEKLIKYLNLSKKEKIPEKNKGWMKKAEGIDFTRKI